MTDYPLPLPAYRFRLTAGDDQAAFQSVAGLEIGHDTVQYKDGTGSMFQMPGHQQPVHVSLRRGVLPKAAGLYHWINSVSLNQIDKRDVSISLTDESGTELLVTWNLANAFPTQLSAPNLDAGSNEVAIEELALLADRVTVAFH